MEGNLSFKVKAWGWRLTLDPSAQSPLALTPPPHCLSPSGLWTLFSPPKNTSSSTSPDQWPRRERAGLHQLPGLGQRSQEEKDFPSCSTVLDTAYRGAVRRAGPQALLCTLLGDLARSSASLSLGPNIPLPLLNRACCLGSWHSVLHLEVPLLSPPPLSSFLPPPCRTCFTDMAWSYRTSPVPYTLRTRVWASWSQAKLSREAGSPEKEG